MGRRRQSLSTSSDESAASRIFIVFPSDKRENVQIDVQLRRIWVAIKWQSPSIVVPNNSLDIQQQQQQFCCCGRVYIYTGRAIRICFSGLMFFLFSIFILFCPHTRQHSIWHVISTSRVNGCVPKKQSPASKKKKWRRRGEFTEKWRTDGAEGSVVHLGLSQNERKMETRRWQTRIVVATHTHDRDDGRHSYLDTQRNKRIASF